jgi:DNA modification methylase
MDPPYGILKDVPWDSEPWDAAKYKAVFQAVARVNSASNFTFAVFGTEKNLTQIYQGFSDAGYSKVQTVVWYKTNAFGNPSKASSVKLVSAFEFICLGFKGNRSECIFNYCATPTKARFNVWEFPVTRKKEFVRNFNKVVTNPAQKPLALLRALLSRHSAPSSTVLDLCSGTGSTAVAAASLGRSCVSVELDNAQSMIISSRLTSVDFTISPFDSPADPFELPHVEPSSIIIEEAPSQSELSCGLCNSPLERSNTALYSQCAICHKGYCLICLQSQKGFICCETEVYIE